MNKALLFFTLCLFGAGATEGLAQTPTLDQEDDQPTIVRAYPKGVPNPNRGGEYTVEIGQEISMDVRGLGTWLQKLNQKQAASDAIRKIITPCLDANGNVRGPDPDWIQNVATASMNLCLYIDGRPFNDVLPFKADPHYSDTAHDTTGCPLITLNFRIKPAYFGSGAPDKTSPTSKQWDELITALILTEVNSVSFHRFQLFLWTIVLAFVFVRSVCINLQMPVFDSTILILMGISGGTYVGFKWPAQ